MTVGTSLHDISSKTFTAESRPTKLRPFLQFSQRQASCLAYMLHRPRHELKNQSHMRRLVANQ